MKEIINKIVSKYLKYRYSSIEKFIKNPFDAQDQVFEYLIGNGKKTRWGDQYDYFNIKTIMISKEEFLYQSMMNLNPGYRG